LGSVEGSVNERLLSQETDDEFDWDRNNGATSSADTGPIVDHTLGNTGGFYAYIEASNPRWAVQKVNCYCVLLFC